MLVKAIDSGQSSFRRTGENGGVKVALHEGCRTVPVEILNVEAREGEALEMAMAVNGCQCHVTGPQKTLTFLIMRMRSKSADQTRTINSLRQEFRKMSCDTPKDRPLDGPKV